MKKLIKKIQNRILKIISFDAYSSEYDKPDPWFKCERSMLGNTMYVDRIRNYEIDYSYFDNIMIQDIVDKRSYKCDDWEGKKVLARIYGMAKARLNYIETVESEDTNAFYTTTQNLFSGITYAKFGEEPNIEVSDKVKKFISLFNYRHSDSYRVYTQKIALEKLMEEIDRELERGK